MKPISWLAILSFLGGWAGDCHCDASHDLSNTESRSIARVEIDKTLDPRRPKGFRLAMG